MSNSYDLQHIFNQNARDDFLQYISDPSYVNRTRLSYAKYETILNFCQDPTLKAKTREEDGIKSMSKRRYSVKGGKLYYTARGAEWLEVKLEHEVFDTVVDVHIRGGHKGITKTYQEVSERFYGIKRDDIERILPHCLTCAESAISKTHSTMQPIIVSLLWERVQVDLIDMNGQPDGEYKWICHLRDHFSKFSSANAMKSKSSQEVSEVVLQWIVHFGPPRILQCDNGKEFKGALLILLNKHGISVINGRPRHPQSQGLIEQANSVLKTKIAAWKRDNNSLSWRDSLPEVILSMNSQRHSTTNKTPYQIVFKQKPTINNIILPASRQRFTLIDEDGFNSVEAGGVQGWDTTDSNIESPPSVHSSVEITDEHQTLLNEVRENTNRSRLKMTARTIRGRRTTQFAISNYVSLAIPSKDRLATDPRRLFCKVIAKPHTDRHQLQTRFGILDRMYPTKELERLPASIASTLEPFDISRKISLRLASRLNSSSRNHIKGGCECRQSCSSDKCGCYKDKNLCTNRCHTTKASGKATCTNTSGTPSPAQNADTDMEDTIPIDPRLLDVQISPKRVSIEDKGHTSEDTILDTIRVASKQPKSILSSSTTEREEINIRLKQFEQEDSQLEAIIKQYDEQHQKILQYGKLNLLPKISWIRQNVDEGTIRLRLETSKYRRIISNLISLYPQSPFYKSYLERKCEKVVLRRGQNSAHIRAWKQMNNVPSGYYAIAHPNIAALIMEDFGADHKVILKKAMLFAGDDEYEHSHILTEVVIPSLLIRMIMEDMNCTEKKASEILWAPLAGEYGSLADKNNIKIVRHYGSLKED